MGQPGESNIYAAMTWDMMIALALAIEATGSANMADVNKNIRTVANAPGTKVHSFAEGKAKLKAGKIDYDGASSILDFDESGDITPDFGVYQIEKGAARAEVHAAHRDHWRKGIVTANDSRIERAELLYYAQLAVNGLSQGLIVGLAALGITLVFGIARFANASAGDGLSFGAYMALVGQRMTGSLLLGAGFAIVASALASVLSYKLVFKPLAGRSSVALLVGSIGLAFLLRGVLGVVFGHQQEVFDVTLTAPYRIGELVISALDLQMAGVAALCLARRVRHLVLHVRSAGRCARSPTIRISRGFPASGPNA